MIKNQSRQVEDRLGIAARQWPRAYLEINHEVPVGKGFGIATIVHRQTNIIENIGGKKYIYIIENLWRDLKHAVHARRPRNICDLKVFYRKAARESWEPPVLLLFWNFWKTFLTKSNLALKWEKCNL